MSAAGTTRRQVRIITEDVPKTKTQRRAERQSRLEESRRYPKCRYKGCKFPYHRPDGRHEAARRRQQAAS